MPYPEYLIAPMRGEMTDMGARELRTAGSRGRRREKQPGRRDDGRQFRLRVRGRKGPSWNRAGAAAQESSRCLATVFAGADIEATDRARQYFTGYAPSSPSIGLLRDGKLVYMMERSQIETRNAEMIADELVRAFDQYCASDAKSRTSAITRGRQRSFGSSR